MPHSLKFEKEGGVEPKLKMIIKYALQLKRRTKQNLYSETSNPF